MKNTRYIITPILVIFIAISFWLLGTRVSILPLSTLPVINIKSDTYQHLYNTYYTYRYSQHQSGMDIPSVFVSNIIRNKVNAKNERWSYKSNLLSAHYSAGFNAFSTPVSMGFGLDIPGVSVPSFIKRKILITHKNIIECNASYAFIAKP